MKKTSNKIVFFGSGPVAAESLRLLLKHCEVEAVITKPSTEREMKTVAGEIPIFTAATKKELDDLIRNIEFESNLGILIDFGIIVSRYVIDSFEKGIINSHFSLLPEWRGADPVTFSILSGQKQTGVSLMLLVEAMDEGPILSFGIQELTDLITGPELTDQLIHLSDGLLKHKVPRYLAGETKFIEQEKIYKQMKDYPKTPSYSRKLTKDDRILDFNKSAEQLEREIRAFLEWPKSRTEIAGKDVIIIKAHVVPSIGVNDKPGDITIVKEAGTIMIATSSGSLCIEELKPAGKNSMSAKAFLAGYGAKL